MVAPEIKGVEKDGYFWEEEFLCDKIMADWDMGHCYSEKESQSDWWPVGHKYNVR